MADLFTRASTALDGRIKIEANLRLGLTLACHTLAKPRTVKSTDQRVTMSTGAHL